MKVRIVPLVGLLFLLGRAAAYSQTLNWASLTGSDIVDSQGIPIDKNAFVFELGTFNPDFVPEQQNVSQWVGNWRVLDTANYSYDPDFGAYFTGTENIQNHPAAYVSLFEGLQAYIFIRNNTNTEFFLARPSSPSSWVFPTLNTGCCPNGEVTTWSVSDLGDDSPLWGSQLGNTGGGIGNVGFHDVQTLAVPEPGPFLLILAGWGLLFFRRDRTTW